MFHISAAHPRLSKGERALDFGDNGLLSFHTLGDDLVAKGKNDDRRHQLAPTR